MVGPTQQIYGLSLRLSFILLGWLCLISIASAQVPQVTPTPTLPPTTTPLKIPESSTTPNPNPSPTGSPKPKINPLPVNGQPTTPLIDEQELQGARLPLRLAFLPWLQLSGEQLTWLEELPAALYSELQNNSQQIELIPPEKVKESVAELTNREQDSLFINQEIIQLSDKLRGDFFLSGSIAKANKRYWILFRVMSGLSGQVVLEKKLIVEAEQLEKAKVVQLIKDNFPALNLPKTQIIDVGEQTDTGEIHIRSVPSQASVAINGQGIGYTPLFLRHVPQGEYSIDLWESLPFKVNRVELTTTPGSANVLINGEKIGLTPLELKEDQMNVGEYVFEVIANEPALANQLRTNLALETTPNEVPVELNHGLVQRTDIRFPDLPNRSFTLTILENKLINVRQNLRVEPEKTESMLIDLYKKPTLVIETSESGADIIIDNELVGSTPFSSPISQGIHKIIIKKERYSAIERQINILPNENKQLYFNLDSARSVDTSIAFVPTGRLRSGLTVTGRYLGIGALQPKNTDFGESVHLYGGEVDYGWPAQFKMGDIFDIGFGASVYYHSLQSERVFRPFYGLGTKLQFLRENNQIPISAAVGAYINADFNHPTLVGYLSVSRYFQDFCLDFGLQTHGLNANVSYTGIPNLKVSALLFIDNPFLPILGTSTLDVSPLYGLNLGYNF